MTQATLPSRVRKRLFEERKRVHQAFMPRPTERRILFIVGCQRSGTSALARTFRNDIDCKTYGEFSELSSDDPRGLRLNELSSVRNQLRETKASLVVLKPLVESQDVTRLLDFFEHSSAVWIYRDYRDVARSNVEKFGAKTGLSDIQPIADDDPENWRSVGVDAGVRSLVKKHIDGELTFYDPAVLFWMARNGTFFEQQLAQDDRVMMLKYDDFVLGPERSLRYIYAGVGQPFPGNQIVGHVHPGSLGRGSSVEVSREIDDAAQALLSRLDSVRATKFPEYAGD